MIERLDDHNVSVDTQLASEGACAQIHLPSGRICGLDHHHGGSCQFVSPPNAARRARVAKVHRVDPGGAV
ncbi:MAG TPA: hypothetical protein VFN75_08925 [Pseudonocardiaceae bacterium]|nr:hypothetical protein [Pseudonocardiaceae bacterium]